LALVLVLAGSAQGQEKKDLDWVFENQEQAEPATPPAESGVPSEPATAPDSATEAPTAPDSEAAEGATPARRRPPQVEEILVTAQRREQAMQEASVSVTSFDMDDLLAQGTTDLTGVAKFTPNLEIKNAFAASNPTLFIRGVGLKDYFANAASAVAVWNDGIYMNSPTGQLFQLFDLEDVQVLKGPQGTRFGRNATAGAILVKARKPTGEYDANFLTEYGNYGYYTVGGAAEAPILDEWLSTRVAFRVNKRDGVTQNRCADPRFALSTAGTPVDRFFCNSFFTVPRPIVGVEDRVNDLDNWAARALVRLVPTDDMEWILNVHGGANRSTALQFQKIGTRPISEFPFTQDRSGYFDADLPLVRRGGVLRPSSGSPLDGDPYAGDYNKTGDEDVDLFGANLTGTWALGDFELTSITGYAQNKRNTEGNEDANPALLLQVDWFNKARQYTQDFRVAWDNGGDVELEAGAWGLAETLDVHNVYHLSPSNFLDQTIQQDDYAWALYGWGSYHLTDQFWLEGGVRFQWDRKKFEIASILQNGQTLGEGTSKEIWRGWTGDLTINYSPVDDVTFYLKYARGFKAGQFNGAALLEQSLFTAITPVAPETTDSFEGGIKSYWWDRRLMLNAALFYTRYHDQQVFQLSTGRSALPAPELINANDSVTYGLELESRFTPWEWLEVFNAFGLLESEYLDFTNQIEIPDPTDISSSIVVTADYSGNRLLNSPEYAWSGSVEATWPIGNLGWLVPRFDWAYKSDVFFDPNQGQGNLSDFPKGTLGQGDLWILNARLAYRTPDERIEIAGWVRNLTDEAYVVDAFDVSLSFGNLWYVIGTPRFYGVSVSYQF